MSKYGLKFERSKEHCEELLNTNHIILTDDKRSFTRNAGKAPNILISGENYHALKMLEYTHSGKIDCTCIDGPYNTGNKDFVYNDRFVDEEDTFRHSKWLSFMEKRLVIARKLLSERGVIFIHIDDNEQARLKVLCDEVFGEENFINTIIWVFENSTMKNPKKGLASKHEYVLMYARNKSKFEINKIREDEVSDKLIKRFGKYANDNGDILFGSVQNETSYLSRMVPKFIKEHGRQPVDTDIIDSLKGNYIRDVLNVPTCRTNELKSRYGIDFDYPKPVQLEKLLINLLPYKDSIVLDFFAGSGTTGQATAELNKEDGGSRQFILVTNNDTSDRLPRGICDQVTFPRLEKTIGDENLQVFRIETLPFASDVRSDNIAQLEANNRMLPLLKLKHNAFTEIEKADKYSIFVDHTQSRSLGVYFNSLKPSPMSDEFYDFKQSFSKRGFKSYTIEHNRPNRGYAAQFFNFLHKT